MIGPPERNDKLTRTSYNLKNGKRTNSKQDKTFPEKSLQVSVGDKASGK